MGGLKERELAILNSIKIQSKSSTVLAEELDVSVDTIQRHYKPLRRYGLITTTPRVGVTLTGRGVQFLKALSQGNVLIPAKNADIQTILSVGEKIKIVYDKARELAKDSLVSKFDVADALKDRVDRNEVFKLLKILDKKEGETRCERSRMVQGGVNVESNQLDGTCCCNDNIYSRNQPRAGFEPARADCCNR